MKNFRFIIFLVVTTLAFTLNSCEIEPLDGSIIPENAGTGGGSGGGTNGGGGTGGGTTGGGTTGGGGTGGGTTGGGTTTTGYYLKVTKDGVLKQWSTIQGLNTTALNAFLITGADPTSSMSLVLVNVSDVGVYNLDFAEKSCNYTEGITIFSSSYSDFTTSAGNITITELNNTNKTIKGTFNFIGKNDTMTLTKVFTKGEFFLQYVVQ